MSDTQNKTIDPKEELRIQAEKMQQEREARKIVGWDFLFSIVVVLFAIFLIIKSSMMPFVGNVGGIHTEWYESPGLLPLILSCMLLLAGATLLVGNLRNNGIHIFKEVLAKANPVPVLISGGGLATYIYVLVTWYDFFLATLVFLLFYISLYYLAKPTVTKKLLKVYGFFIILSAIVFLTGLNKIINVGYEFTTDFILVIATISLIYIITSEIKTHGVSYAKKVRTIIIISILFPLFICPIFRYFLLVPLPHEGLIVEQVFNNTYYTFAGHKKVEKGSALSNDDNNELTDAF